MHVFMSSELSILFGMVFSRNKNNMSELIQNRSESIRHFLVERIE